VCSQNIELKIDSETPLSETFLDSLGAPFYFEILEELQPKTDTITLRLQHLGYLDVSLEAIQKKDDSLYLAKYLLGNRWREVEIHCGDFDLDFKTIELYVSKKTDSTFTIPLSLTQKTLLALSKAKALQGDPFASFQLTQIEKKDLRTLNAQLTVETNRVRKIDNWVVKGYEKFPISFLKYHAGVKKGRVFNQSKLIAQNELVDGLGFVDALKPPEALFKKDSTIVYFYFKKRTFNHFDGILGFATNENTQKLELNGYLDLELNNNLNFGEQLKLVYKADGREQQNFEASTHMPFLFKTPFSLSLGLKIFKRDSTFATTEQLLKLHYQTSPKITVYAGYKTYESSNLLDETLAGSLVENFNSRYLLLGGKYTKRQKSLFFPIKTSIYLESEVGKRKTGLENQDQIRLSLEAKHNFNLSYNNSIFVQSTNSYLNSGNYLANELFRFGGINTLRGFNENSIDASLFSTINTEYRYLFNEGLYVHTILDAAYFENETVGIQERLYSFGLGLGLNTNAGILRLSLANGFSKNQAINASNTKVHLSLSASF